MTKESIHKDTAKHLDVPVATLRAMYYMMKKIRRFEENVAELVLENEIICPCHLYIGQEAVAVGVCSALRKDDWVFSTHRSHGHYIAKGGDINTLMAELYGKATGCSRGRGGSMHIAAIDMGLAGSSAIVSGTIPMAVGSAFAFSNIEHDVVSVAFFGDGAVCEGTFYESLNFAALKKLPVIFVCENNLYSTHMPISECLANTNIYQKASMFNIPGIRINGNNAIEVYKTAEMVIENARRGKGPTLIECLTYRWLGHVGPHDDLDKGLRSYEELKSWTAKCPIKELEGLLLDRNIISQQEIAHTTQMIDEEIRKAIIYAKESPFPDVNELTQFVFGN